MLTDRGLDQVERGVAVDAIGMYQLGPKRPFVPLARALLGGPDLDDRQLRGLLADLQSHDVPASYALEASATRPTRISSGS